MGDEVDVASLKGWRTVLHPNGHDVERSHYVPGNWPPRGHPLYSDERLVGRVTDWLLQQGKTIMQLFLLAQDNECRHSHMVLQRVNVPQGGRVISLGCGVGGMERYWLDVRPDIRFTLVNASRAQLERAVCPGVRILGDMEDPTLLAQVGMQDLVLMGYSLHHANDVATMIELARAYLRPGGTLLVIDVCDGSERFHAAVQYTALDSMLLAQAGLGRLDYGLPWHRLPTEVLGSHVAEVLDAGEVTPGIWLGMA